MGFDPLNMGAMFEGLKSRVEPQQERVSRDQKGFQKQFSQQKSKANKQAFDTRHSAAAEDGTIIEAEVVSEEIRDIKSKAQSIKNFSQYSSQSTNKASLYYGNIARVKMNMRQQSRVAQQAATQHANQVVEHKGAPSTRNLNPKFNAGSRYGNPESALSMSQQQAQSWLNPNSLSDAA